MRQDFVVNMEVPNNSIISNLHYIAPFCENVTAAATRESGICENSCMNNNLFLAYSALYDEFKVDSVKTYFSGITTYGVGGDQPAISICSAWDRKFNYRDLYTGNRPTAANIETLPSASVRRYVNNSRVNFIRSCYASDINERTSFQDTDRYTNTISPQSSGWANSQNFISSPSWGSPAAGCFSPVLMVAAALPSTNTTGASVNNRFFCTMIVQVTFRNPKYSSQASNKSILTGQELPEQDTKVADEEKYESIDGEPITHEDTLLDIPKISVS